jgi:hypothetical protein
MARTLCPLAIFVLLALLSSSGCAYWRHQQQPDPAYTSSGDSLGPPNSLQSLSDVSLHNWDFRHYWP